MAMTLLDTVAIDKPGTIVRNFNLYSGDVADMAGHQVDFLVVSALPGDYSPSPGSVIGELAAKGVSVQAMAANKAATYEPTLPCWISNPVTNPQSGIAFSRIQIYEPANPATTSFNLVSCVFRALAAFRPNTPISVAFPLLSTGSGGADPQLMMRALFFTAMSWGSSATFVTPTINLVVYEANPTLVSQMKALFATLKDAYLNVFQQPPANFAAQARNKADRFVPLPPSLSYRQIFGIALYTSGYYQTINGILRTSDITKANYQEMMPIFECIDSGLANVINWNGLVNRGIYYYEGAQVDYTVGNVISHASYTSYSYGEGFPAPMRIHTQSSTGKAIETYSVYPNEKEVLFQRAMRDQVTRAQWADPTSGTFDTMQVVDPWFMLAPPSPMETGEGNTAHMEEGNMALPNVTREAVSKVLALGQPIHALSSVAQSVDVHPDVLRIIETMSETEFVAPFDWNTEFGSRLDALLDDELLASADLETLRKVFTAHLRVNRFVDGYLDDLVKKGKWAIMFKRLQWLYDNGGI